MALLCWSIFHGVSIIWERHSGVLRDHTFLFTLGSFSPSLLFAVSHKRIDRLSEVDTFQLDEVETIGRYTHADNISRNMPKDRERNEFRAYQEMEETFSKRMKVLPACISLVATNRTHRTSGSFKITRHKWKEKERDRERKIFHWLHTQTSAYAWNIWPEHFEFRFINSKCERKREMADGHNHTVCVWIWFIPYSSQTAISFRSAI